MRLVMTERKEFANSPIVVLRSSTKGGYTAVMITSRDIADRLGRKSIAERLGVGETAVSNAVVRGWFPATWSYLLEQMCNEEGIECPPALFRMRGTSLDV